MIVTRRATKEDVPLLEAAVEQSRLV